MTQRRNLPNLHDRFSKKVFRNHSILLDASFSDLLCDAGPPRRADMINRSKGSRRPPDGWPSRPLHLSLSPLHPPEGEFPTTRPSRARDHASPGRVCHVPCCGTHGSRHRLTALSRPLQSAFSRSPGALCARLSIRSPRGDRIARFDHPLSFPLKGDPPPAL